MNNAEKVILRRSAERMQLLHDALVGECNVDCGKRWLAMAMSWDDVVETTAFPKSIHFVMLKVSIFQAFSDYLQHGMES